MAVSDLGSEGGLRSRMGLHIGVIRVESVKTVIRLALGAPLCQVQFKVRLVRKSYQPLFVVLPGPAGCTCVVVEMWPDFLERKFSLVWFLLAPQP